MRTNAAHHAGVVDRDLLADLSRAIAWWATQRTWRVTSSHTGGGVIAAFEDAVARTVARNAHTLAMPSATTALAAALRALSVAPGSTMPRISGASVFRRTLGI